MQFGQFLDHDLTFTPMYTAGDGRALDCSSCKAHDRLLFAKKNQYLNLH